MTNFTFLGRAFGLLLGTGLVTSVACAQVAAPAKTPTETTSGNPATASLSGRVSSATLEGPGVAQGGATVVIINVDTSLRQAGVADAAGRFVVPGLTPGGPYAVQVQQPGFRSQTLTNVFLKAGEATDLLVRLNVETVAVGTRRDDRTALESAVPVDVVDVATLVRTAPQTDLTQLLHYSVAAFNSTRQTAAGGSDHVDPANLRGLGTDQMLVLVNGKRRHTTALVNLLGNRGLGNVGTDLNTISSLGVERVEVLRDGAAAQYGSDAIAGVMNIGLKTDNRAGSVLASSGLTTEGDGLATLLGINKGFRLGAKGFLNATVDADFRDFTTRGYNRQGNITPVFSRNPAAEADSLARFGKTYADYEQRNGDARTYNVRGLLNARAEVSDKLAFYGFGTYNFRRGSAATLWVTRAQQPSDVITSLFPSGFQPQVNTRIHDGAATVGAVLGQAGPNRWTLDLSNTSGYNQMRYDLENTLNATLGGRPLSDGTKPPTAFGDAGGFYYFQNVSNATANRFFDKVLAGTNVAIGSEFRREAYEIQAGDERTEAKYDFNDDPNAQQGAQGFSGFGSASRTRPLLTDPNPAVRNNAGVFVDVDADIVKRWSVSGAVRYESYGNFGGARFDNVNFKASTRVQATRTLAARAAFNTGFRAPSLQQIFYRQVTQRPGLSGSEFDGIFDNRSILAQAAKVPGLKPESSTNYSAGLVFTPSPAFSFTADVYRIDIDDRITLSGLLRVGSGIPEALRQTFDNQLVKSARFFSNDLDTRTQGLDLVASYRHALGSGQLAAMASGNFTRTTIRRPNVPEGFRFLEEDNDPNTSFIDPRQSSLITNGNPDGKNLATKALFDLNYTQDKFGIGVRNSYFGTVSYYDNAPDPTRYNFGGYLLKFNPRLTTDLHLSYQLLQSLSLTLGAQNLFNIKPNTIDEAATNGTAPGGFASRAAFERNFQTRFGFASPFPANRDVYPYAPVQMGFNGAFVYLKAVYNLGL